MSGGKRAAANSAVTTSEIFEVKDTSTIAPSQNVNITVAPTVGEKNHPTSNHQPLKNNDEMAPVSTLVMAAAMYPENDVPSILSEDEINVNGPRLQKRFLELTPKTYPAPIKKYGDCGPFDDKGDLQPRPIV